ncbi:hypothetical protein F7207_02680 [Helicobacter pylori]|nr:hypothetical protein [Helicobacter pylori]
MFEVCYKNDFFFRFVVNFVVIVIFLNFLKRIEKYSVIIIPQKLKGFFKKSGGFNETLISKSVP